MSILEIFDHQNITVILTYVQLLLIYHSNLRKTIIYQLFKTKTHTHVRSHTHIHVRTHAYVRDTFTIFYYLNESRSICYKLKS